ncbi:hypothetical protein HK097_005628 [Rhizophlyctis rosea]|uniref:Methyltransferase domain-containing protein n=1 Tax=Rhizophlyctis rosea TaxID=64517 RepID=A0AAD5SD68_9FUNG|nr:hypothetical protein HK097_005628 [Rhizophlyctis rosea]
MGNLCSNLSERETADKKPASAPSTVPINRPVFEKNPQYVSEEGRTFLAHYNALDADGKQASRVYTLPSDDVEIDRLHLQHYLLRFEYQSNFCAPVRSRLEKPAAKILDVGCGSGIWAMEMATDFPLAQVYGIDLAPVQPSSIKPKNLEFATVDITNLPLPYEDATFDFVRMRFLVLGIKAEHWQSIVNELGRITKPGGYVELCEPNINFVGAPTLDMFTGMFQSILQARGADPNSYQKIHQYLSTSPYLSTPSQDNRRMPYRPTETSSPDQIKLSKLVRDDWRMGLSGFKPIIVAKKIATPEQFDEWLEQCAREMWEIGYMAEVRTCWAMRK